MSRTNTFLAVTVSTFALMSPLSPGLAQDAAAPPAPASITLDAETLAQMQVNGMTITSNGPITIQFGSSSPDLGACDRSLEMESDGHFGRHGQLNEREQQMARVAWSYFVERYQPDTGLVNAVGGFPSTTMWDTASYISALVSAYELCVIDKREFDTRATKLLGTLRNLKLFRGEAPNKVYHTATGEMVNYANDPGEIGMSALDIGRMLIWLRILKERHPYLANTVDGIPMRWNFCNMTEGQRLHGSFVSSEGVTRYTQEGRLGYEEYAAKGFALWGFDVDEALSPNPLAFTDIYGVQVPYDGRDPRVFHSQNYVLTEGYILDGLELGWDMPEDTTNDGMVASQGWRAEFANRIYLAQQRRYEQTGIITAKSEHQVDGAPYFVYDSIFANGYAWNTLDPTGEYQPDRAAISGKAAVGLWALWDTDYTDLLFDTVAELYNDGHGYYEGLYENGSGFIPLETANNNGIILAALLYKVQGPILRHSLTAPQVWNTSGAGLGLRENKCHPDPAFAAGSVEPAAASLVPPAVIPTDQFTFCRPVDGDTSIGATECKLMSRPANGAESVPVSDRASVSETSNPRANE